MNEVASFVKGGLQDLSVSRNTLDWGVRVPGDDGHVNLDSLRLAPAGTTRYEAESATLEGGANLDVSLAVQQNLLDSMVVAERRAELTGSHAIDFLRWTLGEVVDATVSSRGISGFDGHSPRS